MRRPSLMLVALVGFGAFYLAAYLALGEPPQPGDDGMEIVDWFAQHRGDVRWWLWLLVVGLPLFAVFATLVRRELPKAHGDLFFFGALVFAVDITIQGWLWAGLAWHAETVPPATARTLFDVVSYWGPVLTTATMVTLAPIAVLALNRGSDLPRWLGVLTLVAFAEQAVETITVFGNSGFLAPGGPMNTILGPALVAAAWLGLGICVDQTMHRRRHERTPGHSDAHL